MLSWTALELALQTAVKSASGYADSAVFWSHHNVGHRSGSFIALTLGDMVPDEVLTPRDDMTSGPTTVTHTLKTVKEFTLSIQVFTGETVNGDSSARAIASRIQSSLILPSVRGALATAGIGLISPGSVRYVPEIKGAAFEARAIVEPRFTVTDEVSETTSFIETVNVDDYSKPPLGTYEEIDI
jgi:hypothetical protein